MSTYQKVIIVGHLGQDPETKVFDNGQISTMTIATTEKWKDRNSGETKELTEWHRVVMNGELSKLIDKYLSKGSKVLVEGKLRTRKWTDNNGIDRYTTEIIGREITFLSANNNQASNSNSGSAVDAYQNRQTTANQQQNTQNNEEHDDLPF